MEFVASKFTLYVRFSLQVLVMTPQILHRNLSHCFIKMEMIALLIFDECHHAQIKSNHPYAQIMKVCCIIAQLHSNSWRKMLHNFPIKSLRFLSCFCFMTVFYFCYSLGLLRKEFHKGSPYIWHDCFPYRRKR